MRKILLVLFMLVIPDSIVVQAQDTVVTLALPSNQVSLQAAERFIAEFEADNPGLRVQIIELEDFFFPDPSLENISAYLDEMQVYVSKADVLLVSTNWPSVVGTRAGNFLNLLPLIETDPTIMPDDFYPAAWQAFQWDQGMWALPTTIHPVVMLYDQQVFDEAGLTYSTSWTIQDFANAARTITEMTGEPGMTGNVAALLRSWQETGFFDDLVVPAEPRFDHPELSSHIGTLAQMQAEGVLTNRLFNEDGNILPIAIVESGLLLTQSTGNHQIAPLPGDQIATSVTGFAISSGTLHPQEAYTLVKALTTAPDILLSNGILPARYDIEIEQEDLTQSYPEDAGVMLQDYILNALSASDLRFAHYLETATAQVAQGVDADTALQNLQVSVVQGLETASERGSDTQIIVDVPQSAEDVTSGDVVIQFVIDSPSMPSPPNEATWQRLAEEFAETDAEVDQVQLEFTSPANSIAGRIEVFSERDCFSTYFLSDFTIYSDFDPFLDLEPLIRSDSIFDPDDLVGDLFAGLRLDGQTIGMPLTVMPHIMAYDPERFAEAGLPIPETPWTGSDLHTTLNLLRDTFPDEILLSAHDGGSLETNPLLMFISLYGGLPAQNQDGELAANFTTPENVEAIRQVLDWVKDGFYEDLPMTWETATEQYPLTPLITTQLWDYTTIEGGIAPRIFGAGRFDEGDPIYQALPYPQGVYTPVSFSMVTAHIHSESLNPEACYRFISFLTQHPELFSGMPIYRSQLDDPAVEATRPPATLAFYRAYADILQSDNIVQFPTLGFRGFDTGIVRALLWDAFEQYLFEDAELEPALDQAEEDARAFLDCAEGKEPLGISECQQTVLPDLFGG